MSFSEERELSKCLMMGISCPGLESLDYQGIIKMLYFTNNQNGHEVRPQCVRGEKGKSSPTAKVSCTEGLMREIPWAEG